MTNQLIQAAQLSQKINHKFELGERLILGDFVVQRKASCIGNEIQTIDMCGYLVYKSIYSVKDGQDSFKFYLHPEFEMNFSALNMFIDGVRK